jgi:hypothetical protein
MVATGATADLWHPEMRRAPVCNPRWGPFLWARNRFLFQAYYGGGFITALRARKPPSGPGGFVFDDALTRHLSKMDHTLPAQGVSSPPSAVSEYPTTRPTSFFLSRPGVDDPDHGALATRHVSGRRSTLQRDSRRPTTTERPVPVTGRQ